MYLLRMKRPGQDGYSFGLISAVWLTKLHVSDNDHLVFYKQMQMQISSFSFRTVVGIFLPTLAACEASLPSSFVLR